MLELAIPTFEYKESFSKMLRDYDKNNESFIGDNKFDVEKYGMFQIICIKNVYTKIPLFEELL
jgi:hypothetical protein